VVDTKKLTGSYYTPPYLADFISARVFSHFKDKALISVLEPSVGDGAFIESINTQASGDLKITALDINSNELKKAEEKCFFEKSSFQEIDFLEFNTEEKFTAVIGNPPYIKKNLLRKEQLEISKEIHKSENLSEKSVKNIWTTFLIKSNQHLSSNGVLGFVLPSELLQVKFAEEIREYLKKEFVRIEIFTFNDLMFECKGQDTIVLIAYKKATEKGEFFTNIEVKEELKNNSFKLKQNNILVESKVKWTHHFLTSAELTFLNNVRSKLNNINDFCDSKPGIVTAANKFFIVPKQTEKNFKLSKYTKPIIQRGLFVNGSVVFKEQDIVELEDRNLPTRLLQLNNEDEITKELGDYLQIGEELEIPLRYKCRIRKKWYVIPNISTKPDALFFKRSHHYPKFLKNETDAFVTDSAYKVTIREPYDLNSLIFSFYNSLTLLFSEIDGRYYGGGVLELTPSEFKNLPLPYVKISKTQFNSFTRKFEKKENIEAILNEFDSKILGESIGLSNDEIIKLQTIRKKLIKKRIR
jgi:adenine-specific DNA-methyltransferase